MIAVDGIETIEIPETNEPAPRQETHQRSETARASRTFLEEANAFKLLSGYESKIMRTLEKHQAQLETLLCRV